MQHSRKAFVRIGLSIALTASLSACSLLIPENPSAPRYNDVLGGPRKPELNPGGQGASMESMNSNSAQASMMAAPVPPVAQADAPVPMALPPVSPETQARANEIMAQDVAPPQELRHAPSENGPAPMQVAGGNYPDLGQVPPAPTDDAAARLAQVRAQMEADRNAAQSDKTQLMNDANSEPSLVGTPAPAPTSAPVPAPQYPPQSMNSAAPGYIALPPPPPPLGQANAAPAYPAPVMNMAYAASPTQALEPIMLHPPGGATASAPAPFSYGRSPAVSAGPAPQMQAMAPAMNGGFNPMAEQPITLRAPTSYASGGGYLPESRYTTRRD